MNHSEEIVKAEINNKIFELLHCHSLEEMESIYHDAVSHVEAASASGILSGKEADEYRKEVEKAHAFSLYKVKEAMDNE